MTARFILSLDCEGKWGIADHLTRESHAGLTNDRLRHAYEGLVALLDEFQLNATFAFVECFAMSPAELARTPLDEIARDLAYVRAAVEDLRHGSKQGWHGERLRALVGPQHEIASHGATHVPWTTLNLDQAQREISLVREAADKTWVFPRNAVAHIDVLRTNGVLGYREARIGHSRVASLLSEFNFWTAPDFDPSVGTPQAIPAGRFVNWPAHVRRVVPIDVTRLRARRLLERAVRENAVVHYWTHPENIATHPATLDVLRAILEEVVKCRDRGTVRVLTQREYCIESRATSR